MTAKLSLLDIDDPYVKDGYGRIVAVVYAPYNEIHLLNVNAWLLAKGLAYEWDHPNKFSPEEWRLFVQRPCFLGARPR